MFALYSSNTALIASITCRGFWLVAALSRYTTGLPLTVRDRIGKPALTCGTWGGERGGASGLIVIVTLRPFPRTALRARSRSLSPRAPRRARARRCARRDRLR